VSKEVKILITDPNGSPREWVDFYVACCYHARGKVLWTVGDPVKTFLGGKNAYGIQSRVDIAPVTGVTGPLVGQKWLSKTSKYAERDILYARDRFLCAYCGTKYPEPKLTIDHVKPKSRYKEFGLPKSELNVWTNTVTACRSCNHLKADKTPEEAGMPLLYLPYKPTLAEKYILSQRHILADQMEFLEARIPKSSRLYVDGKIKLD
jgi:5-methylcytosine-specific restriction endonuclease McrA